ncbi:MAG: single-stranded DNA-binding protein [Gemmiger sp.]|uniref:single-stranded DNA-binding protein n=1 Tax=Gemmiger sp. TaxID=2049027 RepID=UPI002E775AA4|nr:single-stranded DNA-binding protein [Gemmiger sp.]MEE0801896.1 single-stranded DNA-binding protein [Gemmiger sp.]
MLNVVAIMGRLVADPQLRQTTTGKNVASFRVAVDRGRRDPNGQNQADFFDVVAWDRSAEFVCRYFQKGSMIAVDGRLQSRNYQDKNGNNRTAIEIVANNINFAAPKSQNPAASGTGAPAYGSAAPAPAEYSRPAAQPAAPAYSAGSNDDFALIEDEGDLPF